MASPTLGALEFEVGGEGLRFSAKQGDCVFNRWAMDDGMDIAVRRKLVAE